MVTTEISELNNMFTTFEVRLNNVSYSKTDIVICTGINTVKERKFSIALNNFNTMTNFSLNLGVI